MSQIQDWDKKLEIILERLGVNSLNKLEHLLIRSFNGGKLYQHKYHDLLRKWGSTKGIPIGYHQMFVGHLCQALGFPSNLDYRRVWTSRIDEFLSFFPKQFKGTVINVDVIENKKYHREWLYDGYIDQKYIYFSIDTVNRWRQLIRNGQYKLYDICKSALDRFVNSTLWHDLIESGRLCDIVMMGAGSVEKDIILIGSLERELLQNNLCIRHTVVDASYYMLTDTLGGLNEYIESNNIASHVDVECYCVDFARMDRCNNFLLSRREGGIAVFFIPGGTICNIEEFEFVGAIKKVMRQGDVVVIGSDFIDDDNLEAYKEKLKTQYDTSDVRDLVIGPIHYLLDKKGIENDRVKRREMVKINKNSDPNDFNSVKHSVSIDLAINIDGKDIILSKIKRYNPTYFREFFVGLGFEYLGEFVGDKSASYRHVAFRRD